MWRASVLVLVACSAAPAPSTPVRATTTHVPAPVPADALAPVPVETVPFGPDPVDDGTTAGAVAVPGENVGENVSENVDDESGVNFMDTTVTLEELPALGAAWQKRERVRYRGRVPVALHISGHSMLALSFVAPVDPRVSDYPGTRKTIALLASETSPVNGNAFGPLRWEPRGKNEGGSKGPIHAAIRTKPLRDSPESERRQVVVYVPPRSKVVLVATKLVTETAWTPLVRVDTPNASQIDLIDPGWH